MNKCVFLIHIQRSLSLEFPPQVFPPWHRSFPLPFDAAGIVHCRSLAAADGNGRQRDVGSNNPKEKKPLALSYSAVNEVAD